ncbi:MOSC domain-containing protein [Spirosoma sp. KNUC1025]|uniref:MOSC domain-containing protein n=1 Tax=Spirosoma sp. KNUC1025 TaxID=2894082 RepID=UPI001E50D04F|nr:MOSC domain-containing protein [Spirosoma sp. KNUC1025]UFH57728.1 MOSC domain-containing protein [Spirosoma sp. KNUC1025]
MHVRSVNVGLPRSVQWAGRTITTGIFKQPIQEAVSLNRLNFVGDGQADLTVHGGPDKAVYAYDNVHYAYWQQRIERTDWAPGLFGENLTTEGLLESEVRIGDLFRVGSALLRAVQPRFPCYKLNVRFDDPGMTHHFARAGRSGIYFRVVEPGVVQANDMINLIEGANTEITIQKVSQIVLNRQADADLLAQLVALPHLPNSLKKMFSH